MDISLTDIKPTLERRNALPSVSVIVPCYNEQEVLPEFYRRTITVLRKLGVDHELVLVNDGSQDNTLATMSQLSDLDPTIAIVDLSRNFGKEIALTAGLDYALGDVVIVIDADLQDPPELIPEFIKEWQNGYDVVYAVRSERDGESWIKKTTAHFFYRFVQSLSRIDIPRDTGDFRLMSRRSIEALRQLREHHRFMKGLFAWVGYPSKPIYYRRDARAAGSTKWNYWKLWNFALEGITSFSIAPLKIATYLGLIVAGSSFVYAGFIIYKTIAFGESVRGYPSLMVVMLFLGGIQLVFTGILGEYLGRVFNEVKHRPLYLTQGIRRSRLAKPAKSTTN
jgi:polyisoprenyl-phosphate glycosyltransferase